MFSKSSEANNKARAAAKMRQRGSQQQQHQGDPRSASTTTGGGGEGPATTTTATTGTVGINSFFSGDPAPKPPSRGSSRSPVRTGKRAVINESEEDGDDNTPPIYSVPTTDTLGDESSQVARRYPVQTTSTTASTDPTSRFPLYAGYTSQQQQSQSQPPLRHSTPPRSSNKPQSAPPPPPMASNFSPARASPMRTSAKAKVNKSPYRQQQQQRQTRHNYLKRRKKRFNPNHDFQHEQDLATVGIQSVSIAQRSAFEKRPVMSSQEWEQWAQKSATNTGGGSINNNNKVYRRMSPSLNHLELLQKQQSIDVVRQVQFSPASSLTSDLLYQQEEGAKDDEDLLRRSSSNGNHKKYRDHDGRYRSINPTDSIPQTTQVPRLAHKKVRLPTRADVGWPKATSAEIDAKQQEIQWEAEWEEISPRLVVLVTSDDLGRAVASDSLTATTTTSSQDDANTSMGSSGSLVGPTLSKDSRDTSSVDSRKRRIISRLKRQHVQWNGGGCGGMPFCGPELLQAKLRNAQYFSRSGGKETSADNSVAKTSVPSPINPYSDLAPPLDASYSGSKIWRPRPFNDRPAGKLYCLACPLNVQLGLNPQEPLICSLTLYTLPGPGQSLSAGSGKQQRSNVVYGKMSENFWFPEGDWRDKVYLDAVRKEDGSIDAELLQGWLQRKHKAIFSYDPLALGSGDGTATMGVWRHQDNSSVYILLQVYKLAHPTGTSAYCQQKPEGANQRKEDAEVVRKRAERVYQQFGTQLLSPLCFGLAKLYSSEEDNKESSGTMADSMKWPQGETRDLKLFASPAKPESQEAFVERLASIAQQEYYSSLPSPHQQHDLGDNPHLSIDDSKSSVSEAVSETTKKRRGGVARLFKKSKVPQSLATDRAALAAADPMFDNPVIDGVAKIFVSSLSSDFLQAMLANPAEWREEDSNSRLPRLLVDVSGDLGVLLDPSRPIQAPLLSTGSSTPEVVIHNMRKRSNLLRLPSPNEPAGYLAASEFREVHYLPARPEKHYDVDTELSYRSLLNLLYLYPHQLRLTGDVADSSIPQLFTLRLQVVQSKTIVDEESGQVETQTTRLSVFHNPSPWAGPPLVDEIYTKTFGDNTFTAEEKPVLDLKNGVAIQDEIKIRLPDILDGTFSLHVMLHAIEPHDMDLAIRPIAEALIPLSSSSSRDSNSVTGRIATIIPNGNHRLRLGDYQLQLESRLVSSIHIGDPAVATVLRDFPYAKDELGGETSKWLDSIGHLGDTFPTILSQSSASTCCLHFDVLLYIHCCNLVNLQDHGKKHNDRGEGNKVAKFMIGNMQSLFEVFRKVKTKFIASSRDNFVEEQLRAFVKKHLDVFDERYLSSASSPISAQTYSTDGDLDVDGSEAVQVERSASQEEDGIEDDILDKESQHGVGWSLKRRKSERLSHHEMRVSRIAATLGRQSGIPFSRVAYGASKIDRMRVEAEIHKEGVHSHFFDDDETIATLATATTYPPPIETHQTMGKDNENLLSVSGRNEQQKIATTSDNKLVRSSVSPITGVPLDNNSHRTSASSGSAEFAQRMRSAAQVMLAPCVGPSLSNILAKSNSPPHAAITKDEKKEDILRDHIIDSPSRKGLSKDHARTASTNLGFQCLPGSDIEEDDFLASKDSFDAMFVHLSEGATSFRGPPDGPMLLFTVRSNTGHEIPVSSGDYVYESIMLLWLRAWLDHVERSLAEPLDTSSLTARQFATFPIPEYDVSQTPQASIFSYYAHMDLLLPICLKSIVLRYSVEVLPMYPPTTKALVDDRHMIVLEPFVEMLARGLVGQAIWGLGTPEGRDMSLLRALSSLEHVNDFLVGLLGVLHPEHVHSLLQKFFVTLRECETEHLGDSFTDFDFEWNEESLHRVRSSRQLRIRVIERLAVLPSFVSLNYPPKYASGKSHTRSKKATWKQQYIEIPESPSRSGGRRPFYPDRIERLPSSGWLSDLLINEGLSVVALSCEAVVAEAMAHIEVSSNDTTKNPSMTTPSLKKRPGAALKRADLLMLQSLSIHAITAVYELILRRHAMDRRYQTDSCRERIAGLFAAPILDMSISSSRWLARMESTHKVRSLWLLCFVYILQEAPECLIRNHVRSLCNPSDVRIHRFIRLLRLCSSTFQSFVDLPRHAVLPQEIDRGMSPWLLQESFNTVCAATNLVVEECVTPTSSYPQEQERMMIGILDLLLHLLTTPQSSVTHLRAVGGALQALEEFGVDLFLEISGTNLQHWIRVILSLMNSTYLSVRSIAVDFVISLLGYTYEKHGDIDFVSIIFVSVLPEVAAREIALYSVSGHISTAEDMVRCLWPLRRSIADLEDSNPLDDDRVDPQLVPVLSVFCRTCQAIMDGVLVEMRLRGDKASVVGTRVSYSEDFDVTFDADEESLFEAATFFVPETAPMQRIRWLLTLKSLHESKQKWVEAAETLYLCARTISDSMPHLKNVWRPSRFVLWSDSRRSLWLDTVGEEMGRPDRGNTEVMDFADDFLEPSQIFGSPGKAFPSGKLQQPTVTLMSTMLIQVAKEAVELYLREEDMDELAHMRLESLLKAVMNVLEAHSSSVSQSFGGFLALGPSARKRHIGDEAALRRVLASISGDMTKLAERLLLLVQSEASTPEASSSFSPSRDPRKRFSIRPHYVVVQLSGKKPPRFLESIGLPTFLEFNTPCICRLSRVGDLSTTPNKLCLEFAQPLLAALKKESSPGSVVLATEPPNELAAEDESKTYLYVFPVDPTASTDTMSKSNALLSKSVHYRTKDDQLIVEMKVARTFPCALSRQRSLLTTEIAKVQAISKPMDSIDRHK